MTREKDVITSGDLDTILEANKKAIEIHTEVGIQNETIIEDLDNKQTLLEKMMSKIEDIMKMVEETNVAIKTNIEDKIEEIEKNLFRLIVILTTIGVGTIIAIVQTFIRK